MLLGLPAAADDDASAALWLRNKSLRNMKWRCSFENEMTIYYHVMWTVWTWCEVALPFAISVPECWVLLRFNFISVCYKMILFIRLPFCSLFYYQRINWIKLKNDYKALTANLTNCDSSLWSNAFIISDITFADGWFSSVNGKIRRQSNVTERINTQEIVNSNGTTTRVQLFGTGGFHDSKAGIWKTWRSVHFTPTN